MTDLALEQTVEAAVWALDVAGLVSLPQADPASWAGSIQSDVRQFGLEARLPVPKAAARPCPEVGVVMMIKDEADILYHNLAWLHFSGVRRFVILDNGSTDATRAELLVFRSRYPDAETVVIDDPRIGYAQAMKTTGMLHLAVSFWPGLRWIFPVDADEFLIAVEGFGPLLAVPGTVDGITIPKVVHFCGRDADDPAPAPALVGAPMERMPLRNKPFMRAPNVACGAHVHRSVANGNHYTLLLDGRRATYRPGLSLGLYYREFQIRGFEHFRRKTLNGGPAVETGIRSGQFSGGDHWLQAYRLWQAHGDDGLRELFRQQCADAGDPAFISDPFLGVLAGR